MQKKGKILRVKEGYNPNSSSMGSVVFAFPTALFTIAASFSIVSGVIMAKFIRKDEDVDKSIEEKDDE